jgi:methylated-DNA-[protein]-cysteine S-methyltransferase
MEKIHFGLLCLVIGDSDGSLTGYAGDYGVKWLLEHENPTTQQSLF